MRVAQKLRERFQAVVGIDIGSANSGCAYAIISECVDDVESNFPVTFVDFEQHPQMKAPTALVLEREEPHQLVSFGYDAYMMSESVDDRHHLLFQLFKDLVLNYKVLVKAENDPQFKIPVDLIVERCMEALRDRALEAIRREKQLELATEDVVWVVTVPLVFCIELKRLMRECANKAGLCHSDDSFYIALEPECAAVEVSATSPFLKPGSRFLVLDCGDLTIDCVAMEMMEQNRLQVLMPPSGSEGGQRVDKYFLKFLLDDFLEKRELPMWCYFDTLRQWQESKRRITSDRLSVRVSMLPIISDLQFNLSDFVKRYNSENDGSESLSTFGRSLKLPSTLVASFFNPVIDDIVELMTGQIARAGKLDYVILTGGFSNCDLLQNRVREAVEALDTQLIIARSPSINTVCGAVRCGLMTQPSPPCDCDALRHEIQDLRERIEIAETNHAAQIQDLEESNIKLLIAKDAEIGDLKLKISEAEENSKEIQEKSARMQALTSELEQKQRLVKFLQTEDARQKDSLRLQQVEFHECKCQLKDLQNQNSHLETNVKRLREEVVHLQTSQDEVEQKQRWISFLEQENEIMEASAAEMRGTIQEQQDTIAALQARLNANE